MEVQDLSPTKITFIGHSTLLININGVNLLTDPILGNRPRGMFIFRRRLKAGRTIGQLLEDKIDGILLSHSHLDHYHVPTLRQFPQNTPFFVPAAYKSLTKSAYKHFIDIHELKTWQKEKLKNVEITAVPANHQRRGQGYVIEGDHTLYFPGDTGYFEEIESFPKRFSRIDVVFLPMMEKLGLWRRFNPHIDEHEAIKMIKVLKPRLHAIPIHFGFYPRRDFLLLPNRFKVLLEQEGLEELYKILLNGQTLELS